MKIEGVSARDFLKSAYVKATEIYNEYYVSDAQYLDFNNGVLLCVSYKNKRAPFIYELLKNKVVHNFINNIGETCLVYIEEKNSFFIDESKIHHQILMKFILAY